MKRIQRKRTKGWKSPENCKYVGRPSKFGNPYSVQKSTSGNWGVFKEYRYRTGGMRVYYGFVEKYTSKEEATLESIKMFREHIESGIPFKKLFRLVAELSEYESLSCWCKEGEPCHADVWIEFVDELKDKESVKKYANI